MSGPRILSIARKEFKHIQRDPRSLWIIFMLPNVMMFLFGYAINFDLKDIRLGACDLSRTPQSRELLDAIDASPYFSIVERCENPDCTEKLFERRLIRALVVIPRDFARTLEREGGSTVGVVIDGSDANSASIVQNYLETFIATRSAGSAGGGGGPGAPGRAAGPAAVSVRPTVLYNPTLDSSKFIVPGLVAVVMMMLGALLTSVTIAREKETGTMEQILVSPVRPSEVIVGKVLPYIVLAFAVAMMIVTVGHFWFKVPIIGSPLYLMLFSVIFLCTALALGLVVSTIVATQQIAIMLSLLLTLLPTIMLSGFIFPVSSIPRALQVISYVIPATHFLVIIRGVMLKGSGPADLWMHIAALLAIGIVLTLIAAKRFGMKLSGKGAGS